jgi:hypothetical protein
MIEVPVQGTIATAICSGEGIDFCQRVEMICDIHKDLIWQVERQHFEHQARLLLVGDEVGGKGEINPMYHRCAETAQVHEFGGRNDAKVISVSTSKIGFRVWELYFFERRDNMMN